MSEPNSPKSPKAYQFMFVLYPESQQAAIDYIKANWPCAWALHDKDTYKILKKGDATMNPTSVEAGAEVAKSAMETVIAAMSDVFTLSGTVVTEITKQPILLFCLAAGLVPVGIHIFSSLKNAARG